MLPKPFFVVMFIVFIAVAVIMQNAFEWVAVNDPFRGLGSAFLLIMAIFIFGFIGVIFPKIAAAGVMGVFLGLIVALLV